MFFEMSKAIAGPKRHTLFFQLVDVFSYFDKFSCWLFSFTEYPISSDVNVLSGGGARSGGGDCSESTPVPDDSPG